MMGHVLWSKSLSSMAQWLLCVWVLLGSMGSTMAYAADQGEFRASCPEGQTLTIAAVGDLLLHDALLKQVSQQRKANEDAGFDALWSELAPFLGKADLTYANLEGVVAEGEGADFIHNGRRRVGVYTGFPRFNYPPHLIRDLLRGGVNVVSTANNHTMDRFGVGIDKTVDALLLGSYQGQKLKFTGTRRAGERDSRSFFTITESHGFRIAWLAFTFYLNIGKDTDDQVLNIRGTETEKAAQLEAMYRRVKDLTERSDVDAVIVTPHWGLQYRQSPTRRQKEVGRRLIEAGALAVLGAHPHVLQPWEKMRVPDTKLGGERDGVVLYSLGNFVSAHFKEMATRTSIVAFLGLTRLAGGEVRLHGFRYTPVVMVRDEGRYYLQTLQGANAEPPVKDGIRKKARKVVARHFAPELAVHDASDLWATPSCEKKADRTSP